jgi:hypothetical protein
VSSSVHSSGHTDGSVAVRLLFKEEKDALNAIKQFNGETADGRTITVKSVGNQPVNLAARLDGILPGDGSVDALLPSTGTSYVTVASTGTVANLFPAENCARTISLPKIREPLL